MKEGFHIHSDCTLRKSRPLRISVFAFFSDSFFHVRDGFRSLILVSEYRKKTLSSVCSVTFLSQATNMSDLLQDTKPIQKLMQQYEPKKKKKPLPEQKREPIQTAANRHRQKRKEKRNT